MIVFFYGICLIVFCFVAREPPMLEVYPKETQVIRVDESAMLHCRATAGIPTPNITWSRRDRRPISMNFKEDYPGTLT